MVASLSKAMLSAGFLYAKGGNDVDHTFHLRLPIHIVSGFFLVSISTTMEILHSLIETVPSFKVSILYRHNFLFIIIKDPTYEEKAYGLLF